MEDGFSGLGEGLEMAALLPRHALLVHGELNQRQHAADDLGGILEPNGYVSPVRFRGEELREVGRVLLRNVEPAVQTVVLSIPCESKPQKLVDAD